MSKPELFNEYFSDALSGKFNANCDPEDRLHQLGALGIACFEKGEKVGKDKDMFVYTPSWAGNYSARLICAPKQPRDYSELQAVMLSLHGPDRDLSFVDDLSNGLVVVSSGMENVPTETDLKLNSTSSIERASGLIVYAAEVFFDTPPHVADLTPGSGQV